MTVKEKLVELLTDDYCPLLYMQGDVGNLADYLIKRGVTVQEWIPVTERLPKLKADILLYFPIEKNMAVGFLFDIDEDITMWCTYTDDGFYTDCDFTPSHWMPLPEPPKGEQL